MHLLIYGVVWIRATEHIGERNYIVHLLLNFELWKFLIVLNIRIVPLPYQMMSSTSLVRVLYGYCCVKRLCWQSTVNSG